MAEREKVMQGLKTIKAFVLFNGATISSEVVLDTVCGAIELLRTQEPMEAIVVHNDISGCGSWWYQCQRCKMAIDTKDKFCRSCGQAVKWV